MKIFGYYIISAARMADIHKRNKTLDTVNEALCDELTSEFLRNNVLEEDMAHLRAKVERVNLSKLENQIVALKADNAELLQLAKRTWDEKTMPGYKLSLSDGVTISVLPDPLVSTETGNAEGHMVKLPATEPT